MEYIKELAPFVVALFGLIPTILMAGDAFLKTWREKPGTAETWLKNNERAKEILKENNIDSGILNTTNLDST